MLRYCWLNTTRLTNDPELYPLSPQRRAKAHACRHESNRLLSLGAGLALDALLATCGLREQDMTYDRNEYGKPCFAGLPELHFNLSHSGDWVLGVLSDRPVGCDVQQVKPMKHHIPDRFFHPDEAAVIAAAPEERRQALFFRYWARKEACVKAVGKGLHLPLKSFRVSLTEQTAQVDGVLWHLTELEIPGCTAALCTLSPELPEGIQSPFDR